MNPPEEMPRFPRTVFETVAERQTYYNIAYLMLSFPLGLFYFVYLVTMLSLGFGLAVTVVGLPLLGLTLVTAQSPGRVDLQVERTSSGHGDATAARLDRTLAGILERPAAQADRARRLA